MSSTACDHIVAATLAAARASTFDLATRGDYLREFDAFVQLIAARSSMTRGSVPASFPDEEASPRDDRHTP